MPNFMRLSILRDLREQIGLTQKQVAKICGLHGKKSHQTIGAWERGEITPKPIRRPKFIAYLWDYLKLGNNLWKFEEIWEILVEEWYWEPISDSEWVSFTSQVRPTRPNVMNERVTNLEASLGQIQGMIDSLGTSVLLNGREKTTSTKEYSPLHIEHTLTVNYDQVCPDETRNTLINWLLSNMSYVKSDQPVCYEVKLQTRNSHTIQPLQGR